MHPIVLFTIATVINITLSTIRSLCTIKAGKWVSAFTNALCYGFYPLIVMLTAKDTVSIITNMIITAVANFVCVWIIKLVEEKARKDRLWKLEVAVPTIRRQQFESKLLNEKIAYSRVRVGRFILFNCYCYTQAETAIVRDAGKQAGAKFSAYESKPVV